jgi:hypothetical protein
MNDTMLSTQTICDKVVISSVANVNYHQQEWGFLKFFQNMQLQNELQHTVVCFGWQAETTMHNFSINNKGCLALLWQSEV